jgi:enterochelin esterase-like enzyme
VPLPPPALDRSGRLALRTPRHARRLGLLLVSLLASLALGLGVLAPSVVQAVPSRATTSVVPLPKAQRAQADTPNPSLDDGFATFTYRSASATSVSLTGSFGPSDAALTATLTKSGDDLFTAVVGPLEPGLYSYRMLVDGKVVADPANPNVVQSTPGMTVFLVPGKAAKLLTERKVAHGRLSVLTYPSEVTGTNRRATVWTPPGYPRRGLAYPTFYLVHGGGGDELDWVQQGRANLILDNLYAAGKIEPMVVVMPDADVPGATGLPAGDTFVPELLENLAPAVRSNFQVSHRTQDQALAGLSLGGLQTFNVLLSQPGQFRYVGDFSSGYFPQTLADLKGSDVLSAANVRLVNKKTRLFRIYIGNRTDIAYLNNVATRRVFDEAGVDYTFDGVYRGSGHTWRTFDQDLVDFAPRLF